ncbi:MAG: hypothetical protein ACRDZM_06600 [Acidimicrobiia bacterium]
MQHWRGQGRREDGVTVKFTGQVRVPEIDHPGVPATVLVEDDQVEVFLEGESLGRWSLFDVQASRLVSSAFSLSMGGEEITFIADEPVDFAYKGVDHMAEVWARYKSMAIPRRVVAVGRSRRGTVPSRIGDLRAAMLQNLEAAGRGVPRLGPIGTVRDRFSEPLERHEVPAAVVEPEPTEPPDPSVVERVFRPSPVQDVRPADEDMEAPAPPARGVRPGPGLFRTVASKPADPVPEASDMGAVFAEPEMENPPPASPWDEPITDEPQPAPAAGPPKEPIEPAPVPESPPEPVAAEVPELVKELLSTSSDEGGEEGARDLVVDLGHYEGRKAQEAGPDDEPPPAQPAKQPVFTGAPAPASPVERGGLLGAVRSAFARNKAVHEHEFVEAPGGIGIVRQICAECGYISIGVSD